MSFSLERCKLFSEICKNWITSISLLVGIGFTLCKINDLVNARRDFEKANKTKIDMETRLKELKIETKKIEYYNFLEKSLELNKKAIFNTKSELNEERTNKTKRELLNKTLKVQSERYQELINRMKQDI